MPGGKDAEHDRAVDAHRDRDLSLPEVAIIVGGAYTNSLGVAAGNILGGIAIVTVVLVLLDGPALRARPPLAYELAERFGREGAIFGARSSPRRRRFPKSRPVCTRFVPGRYELAMSDIVAGNAFLPVLFLLGTLLSGRALLPDAKGPDLYLAALGALLTAVYCVGIILRSKRQLFGAGIDSLLVLALYVAGITGLFFVGR